MLRKYRTRVVIDYAHNIIECLLTLQDYASRQGTSEQLAFVREFTITDSQNERLETLLRQFWSETQAEVSRDLDANLVVAAMMRDDTVRIDDQVSLSSTSSGDFEDNAGDDKLNWFNLDDANRKEVLKEIDVVLLKPFVPPSKKSRFDQTKEGNAESPASPLKAGSLKRVASSYLRSDLLRYDEIERTTCQYGTEHLRCTRLAKKTFIHCRHHLQVVSRKHQARKDRKRLRASFSSSIDTNGDEEPEYEGLL